MKNKNSNETNFTELVDDLMQVTELELFELSTIEEDGRLTIDYVGLCAFKMVKLELVIKEVENVIISKIEKTHGQFGVKQMRNILFFELVSWLDKYAKKIVHDALLKNEEDVNQEELTIEHAFMKSAYELFEKIER
jgi:hypothetical protein